jgi:hypothetical protein
VKVQVERCAGHLGVEMPVRFRLDAREVEIVETIDQWYGPDYCYLKIKRQFIHFALQRGPCGVELTMFQSPGPHAMHLDPEGGGMSMHVTPDIRARSMH